MQLKLRRSQKTSGILSKSAVFVLEARALLRHEEAENIRKYSLGKEVVYASETARAHAAAAQVSSSLFNTLKEVAMTKLSLVITVDSLTRGQQIEGRDLSEIMAAEDAVMTACQNLKAFIETAATFDGRDQVFDI